MITVEIRTDTGPDYAFVCRAAVTVNDDGTYQVDDPEGRFFSDPVPVLLRDPADDTVKAIGPREDAASWARNMRRAFRTGQTVAVVTHDDGLPVSKFGPVARRNS